MCDADAASQLRHDLKHRTRGTEYGIYIMDEGAFSKSKMNNEEPLKTPSCDIKEDLDEPLPPLETDFEAIIPVILEDKEIGPHFKKFIDAVEKPTAQYPMTVQQWIKTNCYDLEKIKQVRDYHISKGKNSEEAIVTTFKGIQQMHQIACKEKSVVDLITELGSNPKIKDILSRMEDMYSVLVPMIKSRSESDILKSSEEEEKLGKSLALLNQELKKGVTEAVNKSFTGASEKEKEEISKITTKILNNDHFVVEEFIKWDPTTYYYNRPPTTLQLLDYILSTVNLSMLGAWNIVAETKYDDMNRKIDKEKEQKA